jgi:hypothetical protein
MDHCRVTGPTRITPANVLESDSVRGAACAPVVAATLVAVLTFLLA